MKRHLACSLLTACLNAASCRQLRTGDPHHLDVLDFGIILKRCRNSVIRGCEISKENPSRFSNRKNTSDIRPDSDKNGYKDSRNPKETTDFADVLRA